MRQRYGFAIHQLAEFEASVPFPSLRGVFSFWMAERASDGHSVCGMRGLASAVQAAEGLEVIPKWWSQYIGVLLHRAKDLHKKCTYCRGFWCTSEATRRRQRKGRWQRWQLYRRSCCSLLARPYLSGFVTFREEEASSFRARKSERRDGSDGQQQDTPRFGCNFSESIGGQQASKKTSQFVHKDHFSWRTLSMMCL